MNSIAIDMNHKTRKIEKILDAALRVFLRHGYEAARMDMIAEEAGVARRTLYNRFPNGKDSLLTEAVKQVWEQSSPVSEFVNDPDHKKDARKGLLAIGNYLYDFWTSKDNIALIQIIIREPGRFPDLTRAEFDPHEAAGYRQVVTYMRQLTRAGLISVRDPVLAARHFTGLIRDPLFWPLLTGEGVQKYSRKKLVETAVDLFLKGYATTKQD